MDPPITGAASWPGWCRRWRGAPCTSAPAPGWPGPSTPWCGGTRSSSTGPLPPHSPPSPPLWLLAETLQYAPFVTVVFVTFLFVSVLVFPASCTCPQLGPRPAAAVRPHPLRLGRVLEPHGGHPPLPGLLTPQAGGRSDGIGLATRSRLVEVVAGDGVLATTSLPAYWIRRVPRSTSQPRGEGSTTIPSGEHCQPGDPSYNAEDTHQVPGSKH